MVKDAGFDNWVSLFKFKNDWALNPDLPVVDALEDGHADQHADWMLERNPYSVWVDTEGNQLPYIDKIQLTLAENLEVVNLRAIAGEFDMQERHIDIGKLPVFLENQQKGNYKVDLDPGRLRRRRRHPFNLSYEADPEIAKWLATRRFPPRAVARASTATRSTRRSGSGLGTPGSVVPGESNKYNPGPECRTQVGHLDLKKANELLDKIGLTKKDGEGFRLRTDNGQRLRIELMTLGGQFVQFTQIGEMVREQWKKIGLQADVNEHGAQPGSRSASRPTNTRSPFGPPTASRTSSPRIPATPSRQTPGRTVARSTATGSRRTASRARSRRRRMKEMMDLYRKAYGVPDDERIKLTKQVWKILAEELWTIGTVGLSPATTGVRIVKNTMGNIPDRLFNSASHKSPGSSLPPTYFFKS